MIDFIKNFHKVNFKAEFLCRGFGVKAIKKLIFKNNIIINISYMNKSSLNRADNFRENELEFSSPNSLVMTL